MMKPMKVLVSDTSILIDLERGSLLEICFRLPFQFAVPDLLYERELKTTGAIICSGSACESKNWIVPASLVPCATGASNR